MLDSFRIMRYHFTSYGTVLNEQGNKKINGCSSGKGVFGDKIHYF